MRVTPEADGAESGGGRTLRRRISAGLLVVMGSLPSFAACALFAAPIALGEESCSNAALRVGFSSGLPDCRAYEMVTPPDKDSGETRAIRVGSSEPQLIGIEGMQASVSGDRMAWTSEYPLPGSASPGLDYLSTRRESGWSSENVIPPQSVNNGTNCPVLVGMAAYSSDLSRGVLADGFGQSGSFTSEGVTCGHDEPRLVSGEPEGFQNLFLRDDNLRSYQLVNVTPPNAPAPKPAPGNGGQYFPAGFLAGSSDLSHVVFEEELELTPEAPSGDDLYEWTGGAVHFVSLLPDGTPVLGTLASSTRNTNRDESVQEFVPYNIANYRHAVSGNGTRVFFETGGNLYVRENPEQPQSPLGVHGECTVPEDACTVQVDASQASGLGGGGRFMVASEDGSKVFFTDADTAGLTSDTVAGSGQNLYEYNLESRLLTDLTPASEAKVKGVSGASEDGSYVYFVAEGALASNTTAGHDAIAGQPNLYVFHAGVLTFIATLNASSDSCDWLDRECVVYPNSGGLTARVSANGAFIGFGSDLSLTGYDNTGLSCVPLHEGANVRGFEPGSCQEVFLYEAAVGKLNCASCDPDGAVPAGPAMFLFPAATSSDAEMRNAYPQRNVSDNGQVFFETLDPLVSGDTNHKRDVYEYENGRPVLISSGTSEADSYFLDASVNGDDVFFATAQRLIARDGDDAYDIYDARVNGGFPELTGSGPSCEGEDCRGTVDDAAPVFSTPSSAAFSGIGNLPSLGPIVQAVKPKPKLKSQSVKCKKRYVKKKGTCVRKHGAKAKQLAERRK